MIMSNVIEYPWGEEHDGDEAYAQALKAVERLFLKHQARIVEQGEEARVAAEQSDFADHRMLSHAAARATNEAWDADEQMSALKQRLDELYRERVVEPIMKIRRLSEEMEQRNRKHFSRRVGDVPR